MTTLTILYNMSKEQFLGQKRTTGFKRFLYVSSSYYRESLRNLTIIREGLKWSYI